MLRLSRTHVLPLFAAMLLGGCAAPPTEIPSPTPTLTPTPRPTATLVPQPVLDADAFWVAADGQSTQVIEVQASGDARTIPLPLNEGQSASDMIASPDGAYLAYLVWDVDGGQHGIASWKLIEPNARLIVQPQEGYRVISMMIAADNETLIFLQTNGASQPQDLKWRLESAPAGGGTAKLIADESSLPGLLWPLPIAWPEDGPIYLHASVREGDELGQGVSSGVFALDLDEGNATLITPPEDPIVLDALLSPDGTQIAYTPGTPLGESSVVKVRDLETGETQTLAPGDNGVAISMAWDHASGDLLLDTLRGEAQSWARVEIGSEAPWPESPPDADRARLFMYAPYGDGAIYTLLPEVGEGWTLYILPEIGAEAELERLPIDAGVDVGNAPLRLVHVPR